MVGMGKQGVVMPGDDRLALGRFEHETLFSLA